jgi:dihydroxyacetone kinase DhaKLM complex PTS-EIIA-like component DhaM
MVLSLDPNLLRAQTSTQIIKHILQSQFLEQGLAQRLVIVQENISTSNEAVPKFILLDIGRGEDSVEFAKEIRD